MPPFEPNRAAGLAALDDFSARAGRDYQRDRNYDPPPSERRNVSMLSPYLRHRLIDETEVLRTVLAAHTPNDAFKFVQEVYWRTYYKGWLEHRPAVWMDYLSARDDALEHLSGPQRQRYEAAVEGRSGIEPFDAWAKELVDTGYLHNHARMWFASIWLFTLELPWSLGAAFFYHHLLDGDPASNTLSWRWVAGLHTPGKTYLATPGNIQKYAADRFDPIPARVLVTRAAPVAGTPNPPACELELPPERDVASEAGLLIHEEDLGLEWGPRFAAVAALASGSADVSGPVHRFRSAAVVDALGRAGDAAHPTPLEAESVVDWLTERRLASVAIPYVPVGHTRTRMKTVLNALEAAGVDVIWLLRDHDRAAWPFARAGFFKLGKQIPKLLARAGLAD